jgi:ATP-binding cassette subfamily C protein CydD
MSGAALELIATLSVALVAVAVGLRLQAGGMNLVDGLAIIMLAPEVFVPLRGMGTHFHASANGVAASQAAFNLLEIPLPKAGSLPAPSLKTAQIRFTDVSVKAAGRGYEAPKDLSFTLDPGALAAFTGPNGAGKSTAVAVLLGLIEPDHGTVEVVDNGQTVELNQIDPASWFSQIVWVPQRPVILPGTALQNLLQDYETPGQCTTQVIAAARAAAFDSVIDELPDGWQTRLGHGGVGLSVGQRQRLALARAFLAERQLVILDEPTAHLDAATEAAILNSISELNRQAKTCLVVAHRPSLLAEAHQTIPVHSGALAEVAR